MLSSCQACTPPKHQKIRKRVAAETIRTVKTGGGFAGREESGQSGFRSFRIDANTAHHVMARWANLHGALGDVHIREFLELVIHAGKFFLHILSGFVGDVEIRATVFGATALLDFRVDGAGYDVARGKFHALGIVLFHEALACLITQDAAFTAHGFGDENPLHAGWPDHARGMKLNKLHVHELGAGLVGKGHPVAGVLPGVGSNAPGFANAASGNDD